SSGPNAATPQLDADLAMVAADQVAEDVDIMREPVLFPLMPFGGGLSLAGGLGTGHFGPPSICTYNSSTQRVECPTINRGSLTVTRSYQFKDENGNVQQQYDPLLTASANLRTMVDGELSHDAWSASIHRERDLTATGLLGEETQRTWNGTGASAITRSRHTDNGEERSYNLSCETTVDDVVLPVPRSDERFPISGTITIHCTVTFVGGPRDGQTIERTMTITFDGDQTATVTVGDRTFEIDLKARHRRDR
ncbi:MAG: hypothetical protein ACT4PM_10725, partial [Gemmatimonadales bacterium]